MNGQVAPVSMIVPNQNDGAPGLDSETGEATNQDLHRLTSFRCILIP